MALPTILAPPGTPPFRTAGHSVKPDEHYANVKYTTGHSRQRRLYSGNVPRTVTVVWELSEVQMAVVDDWAENVLKSYSERFSANVASNQGRGVLWWDACWVEPYTAEPLDGGRWTVSGSLYLIGEGSSTPPITGALASEVSVPVVGKVSVRSAPPFGVEIFIVVSGKTPRLAAEIFIPVTEDLRESLLREDGSYILRETVDRNSRIRIEEYA